MILILHILYIINLLYMCTIRHTCVCHNIYIYTYIWVYINIIYIYISANSRRSMLNFIWLNTPDFPDSSLQAWFEREIRMTSSITAAALCEPDKNESHGDLTSDSIRSISERKTNYEKLLPFEAFVGNCKSASKVKATVSKMQTRTWIQVVQMGISWPSWPNPTILG